MAVFAVCLFGLLVRGVGGVAFQSREENREAGFSIIRPATETEATNRPEQIVCAIATELSRATGEGKPTTKKKNKPGYDRARVTVSHPVPQCCPINLIKVNTHHEKARPRDLL